MNEVENGVMILAHQPLESKIVSLESLLDNLMIFSPRIFTALFAEVG
jgi:hypothetical protein